MIMNCFIDSIVIHAQFFVFQRSTVLLLQLSNELLGQASKVLQPQKGLGGKNYLRRENSISSQNSRLFWKFCKYLQPSPACSANKKSHYSLPLYEFEFIFWISDGLWVRILKRKKKFIISQYGKLCMHYILKEISNLAIYNFWRNGFEKTGNMNPVFFWSRYRLQIFSFMKCSNSCRTMMWCKVFHSVLACAISSKTKFYVLVTW